MNIKHLEIIQTVINRMANSSFLIKGWCVTLVSGILALASKDPNKKFIIIAYFPVLMFWMLDGYFLNRERLFRRLYDQVRTSTTDLNFSMDTSAFQNEETWPAAMFSRTLLLFYLTMICVILIPLLILLNVL